VISTDRKSRLVLAAGALTIGMLLTAGIHAPVEAADRTAENTKAPWFTAVPTILLRTPDPGELSKFYIALGMKVDRINTTGTVVIYHENGGGSLEIARMQAGTQPGGPKTSRTQQGVVAIFETTDLEDVVRRAQEAGSPLIEKGASLAGDHPIYYIADWENNVFGYTTPNHNPALNTHPNSDWPER
jgi:predicted enzyme related to lactoylglutathione lyase